jgi:hypothetical protein
VMFGVLPVTIMGGPSAFFGVLFGSVSVFLAVRERALNVLALWAGVLALAACGLLGFIGVWAMIALSAGFRPPRQPVVRLALFGTIVGVLAAVVTLVLMVSGIVEPRPLLIYILVAPILVVLHRRPALKRLLGPQRTR